MTRETQLSFWLLARDSVKEAEITAYFAVVKNFEKFKFLAPPPPKISEDTDIFTSLW